MSNIEELQENMEYAPPYLNENMYISIYSKIMEKMKKCMTRGIFRTNTIIKYLEKLFPNIKMFLNSDIPRHLRDLRDLRYDVFIRLTQFIDNLNLIECEKLINDIIDDNNTSLNENIIPMSGIYFLIINRTFELLNDDKQTISSAQREFAFSPITLFNCILLTGMSSKRGQKRDDKVVLNMQPSIIQCYLLWKLYTYIIKRNLPRIPIIDILSYVKQDSNGTYISREMSYIYKYYASSDPKISNNLTLFAKNPCFLLDANDNDLSDDFIRVKKCVLNLNTKKYSIRLMDGHGRIILPLIHLCQSMTRDVTTCDVTIEIFDVINSVNIWHFLLLNIIEIDSKIQFITPRLNIPDTGDSENVELSELVNVAVKNIISFDGTVKYKHININGDIFSDPSISAIMIYTSKISEILYERKHTVIYINFCGVSFSVYVSIYNNIIMNRFRRNKGVRILLSFSTVGLSEKILDSITQFKFGDRITTRNAFVTYNITRPIALRQNQIMFVKNDNEQSTMDLVEHCTSKFLLYTQPILHTPYMVCIKQGIMHINYHDNLTKIPNCDDLNTICNYLETISLYEKGKYGIPKIFKCIDFNGSGSHRRKKRKQSGGSTSMFDATVLYIINSMIDMLYS